jgi:hypothetical protein
MISRNWSEMKNKIIINTGTLAGIFMRANQKISAIIHNETHRKYPVISVNYYFFFIEKK